MTTKVLLAGDSLALGLTAPLKAEAARYGIDLVGDGRTGTTAKQWVGGGWLAADIEKDAPNVTLISLGTNDATGDLGNFAHDVQTLIDQATSKGGVVAWIGPPYFAPGLTPKPFPPGNVDKMRQTLLSTLTPRGIELFPSDADAPQHDYSRSGDGIHMTQAGFAAWAHDIAQFAKFSAAVPGPVVASPGMSKRAKWIWGGIGLLAVGGVVYAVSERS